MRQDGPMASLGLVAVVVVDAFGSTWDLLQSS